MGQLGEEFSAQFAAKGFSIFLIGRNAEKLQTLTEKLKQASPNSQYRSHAIDLEKPTEEEWADLEKDLDSLPGHVTARRQLRARPG